MMATEGTQGRQLAMDDLFAMRWLSDVRLCPDGSRLACVETRCDEDLDRVRSRVLIIDLIDGSVRSVSHDDASDIGPRWAPDGSALAFIADRGDGPMVWIVDDGDESGRAIAGAPLAPSELAWHPDGERLAVTHAAVEDASDEREAAVLQVIDAIPYQLDGRPVRRRSGGGLRIVGLDGTSVSVVDGDGTCRLPTWSPDGATIAWIASDTDDRTRQVADLFVAGTAGDGIRRLTGSDGRIDAFAWSPDGDALATLGHSKGECLGLSDLLRVLALDHGAVRDLRIARDPALGLTVRSDDARGSVADAMIAWVRVAGSDRIYTRWAAGGRGALGWVDLAGRLTTVIDDERAVLAFDVDPSHERLAFVAADAGDPGEVSLSGLDGGIERVITQRNRAWRSEVSLGTTELLDVRASDGQALEAWLIRPPAVSVTGPVPVILSVHGGPHYPVGWRFYFEHQRLAALGYAVIAGNPRGSAGYGDDFATAVHDDWGGIDHGDLMAIVDRGLREPGLDAERLAITGVSYGGYMTLWSITRDGRFSAAISENGISDLTSAYGTSHDGGALMGTELGGPPWERSELYVERSPLTHAARVTTPLLLLHAELDRICPIGQSEEMFTALRRLGGDVSFVRAQGEGHLMNLTGGARFRRARAALVDEWLSRWLSPA